MRAKISAYISTAIFFIILLVAGLTPLIFANQTTEFFEIPKMAFFIGAVVLLIVLWSINWVVAGKVFFTRTPLDIPFVLLLGVLILSTVFSDTKYISLLGNFPRIHGSLVSWIAYILFYFVAVSNLKTFSQVKLVFYTILASTVIVALISLLSYFGIYLPLDFAQAANFNPTGSAFSATALMVILLPLLTLAIINPKGFKAQKSVDSANTPKAEVALLEVTRSYLMMPQPVAIALSILFGITIALTGLLATQIAALVVVVLTLLVSNKTELKKNAVFLILPVIASVAIYILGFFPANQANIFYQKQQNFPREIQLPFIPSWKVSASAFRDIPFQGSGPSTYIFNYSIYRPVDLNLTNLWNLRFDTAFNEYLQILGTLGGLGFIAFVFLTGIILFLSWGGLIEKEHSLNTAISISAVSGIAILLFHVTTPTMLVVFILVLAMLMVVHKSVSNKVEELSIGIKASKITDSNLVVGDILPYIMIIPILGVALIVFWNEGKFLMADYYHRMALNSATTNAQDTYKYLQQAEILNPLVDTYRTDLAQTNFALANAIARAKGPTESSAAGSLTDKDKQDIQILLSQSIREGRAAVALSPRSAQNFEILASIYRQITGVADNALEFALDSYGQAINRDPLNPVLRLNVGQVYYAIKNYDLAARFFTDAITLKNDYANAYFNLAYALKEKGDTLAAQAAAERLVSILEPNTPDYEVATKLVADLKATNDNAKSQQQSASPIEEDGALQQESLPNVLDLPKPENISTPAAVQKSPTPAPTSTPAATAAPTATPQ